MEGMDQKRTFDEVSAIYALEPDLKDIYVEGWSDKLFVEWFLSANDAGSVCVYPIDVVEIPDAVLKSRHLTLGSNRSAVVALALELAQRFPAGLHVLCIADRDFEDYCPHSGVSNLLSFTDCNSLELYAFTRSTLRKFTSLALGGYQMNVDDLMAMVSSTLDRVYACRVANEILGWGMEWIPFSSYVDTRGGTITFDEQRFVMAYLQKNNRWNDYAQFERAVKETLNLLPQDTGRRLRGHDLCELLLPIFRKMRKERKFGNVATLEGCLMATVECRDLERMPLFQRILLLAHAV